MPTHQNRSIKSGDRREAVVVFFDVELDDMELTPYEYRVYGRIARRAAGGHHACTESLDSMAAGCQIARSTLMRAIRGLIQRRMIVRESKLGETSTYYLTDKSRWIRGASETQVPGASETHPWCATDTPLVHERPTHLVHQRPTKNTSKVDKEVHKEEEKKPAAHTRLPALDQPELIHVEPNAVSVLLEVFPQTPIYSQEVIDAADIRDLTLWRQVLSDWRDNRYSTRNVTGMRDRYRAQLAKQEEQANGQNRTRQNNGRQTQQDAARAYNERMRRALERRAAVAAGTADPTIENHKQLPDPHHR